jgi:large repetitive protein
VQDVTPPVIACPQNRTIECNESTDPNVNTALGVAIAIDNCDPTLIVTYIDTKTQVGACLRDTIITRTWAALDDCNNQSACQQTITKKDTQGPVVVCPADTVINCNTSIAPLDLGFATATDNCGTATVPTHSDAVVPGNCPQESVIIRTWTSEDDCGNIGICEQTITVQDTTLPNFAVPVDITIYTDANCVYDATVGVTGDVTNEGDNCATGLDATFTDDTVDGQCAGSKIITRTWSLNDGCGNVLTQNQIITVSDTLIPVFPKPADMTLTTENGATCPATAEISLVIDQVNPVATGNAAFTFTVHGMTIDGPTIYSDNCTDAADLKLYVWNIIEDWDGPADACKRNIRVIWRVYDDCGNFRQRQQIFTIIENTPPVITCPANVTINCEDPQIPVETGEATATDNCDAAPVVTSSDNVLLGGCLGNYAIERTWTATDQCNNSTTCVQVIAVQDLEAPVLACPADTVINCEVDPIPANTGAATATDNCDALPTINFTDVSTPGNCPDARTIVRTWTAFDACGNQAIPCTQIITVRDTTKPVIICPLDITINCEVATIPANTGTAIASDNCDLSLSVTMVDTQVPGDCPQEKVINRRWVAVDNCLNAIACIQRITVQDTTRPALVCPVDMTVECDQDLTPAGTGSAAATDNCDAAPVVLHSDVIVVSVDCPQNRVITRTWTATDACGNVNTCVQTINVVDTTPPVIACPNPLTVECDQSLTPGANAPTGTAIAIDNCDPMTAVVVVDDVVTPSGTCPQEKTIERTWAAVDACGNAAACVQLITVVDDTPPVVVCPADTVINCNTSTAPAAIGFATATDNCGTATVPTHSDVVVVGQCPQDSIITRTWTSVDDCGNIGTCVQIIMVQDTTRPVLVCPADTVITCDTDFDPMNTGFATATDNCDPNPTTPTFTDAVVFGNCPQQGVVTRTWTWADACGNVGACVQTITVIDTVPPTFDPVCQFMPLNLLTSNGFDCPADATISLQVGQILTTSETWTIAGFTVPTLAGCLFDNCSGDADIRAEVESIVVTDALPCARTITVSFRLRDACGNEQPTLFVCIYNIYDNTAPLFTVPADVTLSCELDVNDLQLAGDVTDEADNCVGSLDATYSDVADLSGCNGTGAILRIWTLTDGCGNTLVQTQTITVVDNSAPTLVCPQNTTVSCDDTTPAAAGTATSSDNCGTPTVNYTDQSTQTNIGLCSDQSYTITRTWTAVDDCGNQASACIQIITVQDLVAPVITCPADATVSCEQSLNPMVNTALGTATSVDNCDPAPGVSFTDFSTAGNCPQERTILRTWLTVDNCLNPAACTQTIVVVDNTPPALVCPKDTVVNCQVDPTVNITGIATATDLCDGNPTVSHSDVSTPGACPTLRTIARTWIAADACGNSTICVQTITVQDTTRPVIVCPANVTVQCNESTDPMVNPNVGTPTLSDNCDQMLASNYIDNPLPPNGCTQVILRNWITSDDCNNAAACSQTVTVTDTQAPILVDVPADVTVQCDAIPTVGTPIVSDNCDTNPTATYIGETPITGQCPDSYILLRSWSLSDNCGNSTIFVQTITVQDTQAPSWVDVPGDITVECDAVPAPYQPAAEDNCDASVTVTYDGDTREDSECADTYTLTRTWTAVDNCNNSTTYVQTILVQDTQAPNWIDVPSDITVECDQVPTPYQPAAEDNCDAQVEITFSETRADGNCPNRYVLTRTWMASDNCSNSTVHTQTITVTDNTPPTAVCQNITVELNQNGEVMITGAQVDNGSSDNCGDVSLAVSPASFTCANVGTNTVILTVTDACGQTATCSSNVTVTLSGGGTTLPTVTLSQNPALMCSGDTYNLTLTPGVNNAPGTEYMVSWAITPSFVGSTPDPNLVTLGGDFGGNPGNGMITTTSDLNLSGAFDNLNVNSVIITFTVTPKSNGCSGTPQVVATTLRPLPQVTSISPIPPSGVCSGSSVGGFTIGHNLGTGGADASNSIAWSWSGTNLTATPANGTDNGGGSPNALFVSPTTLVNTGATATTATLSVIPRRTTAGLTCSGPAIELQIVVEPELQIACPSNLSLSTDMGSCTTAVALTHPTTNINPINCPVTLEVGFSAGMPAPVTLPTSGSVTPGATVNYTFAAGQTIVSYKAIDGNGNSKTCSFVVNVTDNEPPVWITQSGTLDRTVECGNTSALDDAQALAPMAADNCGSVVPVKTSGSFAASTACPPVGTYTNTWSVVDAAGNTTAVFMQTITISDTEAPTIICPDDLVLECGDGDLAAQIMDWLAGATATDNCAGMVIPANNYDGDSIPAVSCDLTNGLLVSFTATDNCSNSAACAATIYVLDTEGPTINGDCALLDQYGNGSNAAAYIVATSVGAECPAVATVNLQVGQEISDDYEITVGGIAVPGILGCLTDNCTATENLIARVVAVNESGDACIKNFEVRFVIEDACGNQSADTITYILEVADNTAPTFTKPADVTVYLDGNCEANLSGTGAVEDEEDNCATGLQATFTDNTIPGQGASEYIIERTWTLTDGCGNTASAQIQYITVLDTIRPVFDCPNGIEIAPNATGCTYLVDGSILDPRNVSDNCGATTATYDLDGDTEGSGSGSLNGVTFNEGTTTVTWTVTDGNGNTQTCSFAVVVTECTQISGMLIWEGDDSDMTGVALANVALSGDDNDSDGPTLADGNYTLIAGMGTNFVVTPDKTSPPANPLNGVSVLDALLVQQYIVGLHTFPDGYKMIAADVNLSNAITTLDASLIRQAILGSPGALAYFLNKPWRFVPTKDDTPYSLGYDPGSNPFLSPIPSTRVLTGVAGDAVGEDFYGIKTGDVNATGNPENRPENLDPLRLRIQDRVLEAGQNIFVPVRMAAFDNLAGYQFAFDFDADALELLSVEAISSPLGLTSAGHFGLYQAAAGEIRSAWIDPYGQTIAAEMPVFALRFAVKQSGAKLSEVLRMKPKAISPEAYNMDHQVAGIELEFYEEQTTSVFDPTGTEAPGMTLLQNRPNPFTERTTIGFSLDQGCDAQLRIFDASGRELYRLNKTYPAGKHEEVIFLRDIRATGVLYYELKTPYGTLTKKMTALTP